MGRSYAEFYERNRLSKAWNTLKKFGLWLGGDPSLLNDALAAVRNAYELVVKEVGYVQYEADFTERLDRIQADLNATAER
jgi:hypothetical protein